MSLTEKKGNNLKSKRSRRKKHFKVHQIQTCLISNYYIKAEKPTAIQTTISAQKPIPLLLHPDISILSRLRSTILAG